MMRSFLRLQQVDVGVDPENVLTMTVPLPSAKYREPERRSAFFQQLVERARTLPGVREVGAVSNLPLGGSLWGRSLTVEGRPVLSVGEAPMINHCVVTPGYFRAMGIPVQAGRDLADADAKDAPKVTVVDERLAREYWPGESAVGKRVRFGPPESNEPWHTVVGVVGAVRHERADAATRMSVYVPYQQIPVRQMTLAVRTEGDPAGLASALRGQVRELDPDQPVTSVRTMEEVISRAIWQPRLHAILFGVFAAVALALASVGIYGVMSYAVTQRTHEIGVRVALGARPRDILRLVVGHGLTLTLVGIALGAAAAFALTRVMSSLLFEVSAADPATFAANVALLAAVSLIACYIPARRATRVDPLEALRYE